jgi:hypothetical protein
LGNGIAARPEFMLRFLPNAAAPTTAVLAKLRNVYRLFFYAD